jgi:hypothetical protein
MYLPNILVPQGAYKFVIEMDRLIRKLPVDEPEHSGIRMHFILMSILLFFKT